MILTKNTLYDDFTYKGKFWLPPKKRRKPRKIDGILRVTAGKHIALELFGDFAPFADALGGSATGAKQATRARSRRGRCCTTPRATCSSTSSICVKPATSGPTG
jgi:hypothetical protein